MRIVVMSDSHGRADRVKQVIEQQPQAELFIFLGDGLRDFRQAMRGVPKEGWCVCGNCDFVSDVEYNLISYVRDVKFFCTHGHQWGVKAGLDELALEAKKKGACCSATPTRPFMSIGMGSISSIPAASAARAGRCTRPMG